jgi:hypothetical protein
LNCEDEKRKLNEEVMRAMRESGAWKWMLGLAAAVLVAKTGFIEAVFSVLLLLALASAILFSLALFSMDFVEAAARGLEFLEGRVCHAADRARTILSHCLHHVSACADPRQGLFLLLPMVARSIGRGIQRLLRPHGTGRDKFVEDARKGQGQEFGISRECR